MKKTMIHRFHESEEVELDDPEQENRKLGAQDIKQAGNQEIRQNDTLDSRNEDSDINNQAGKEDIRQDLGTSELGKQEIIRQAGKQETSSNHDFLELGKKGDSSQSQIRSLIQSEVSKQMKQNTSGSENSSGKSANSSTQPKEPSHTRSSLPHLSYPSAPKSHSRSHHKPMRHKGQSRSSHDNRTLSKPHHNVNVVYKELERINSFPNGNTTLIPFHVRLRGNYFIYSPIKGSTNPNVNMKRVLGLRQFCIDRSFKYLPIYTYDDNDNLIDIVFVVFPKGKNKNYFSKLRHALVDIIDRIGCTSYLECIDGYITLITEKDSMFYCHRDLCRILNRYSFTRGIDLSDGSELFLNPIPKSDSELSYRTSCMEICLSL